MLADKIFIYHLDNELQKLFQLGKSFHARDVANAFNLITRVAFLLCKESIIVPLSNYMESDLSFRILNKLRSPNMMATKGIQLVSSSYNLKELFERKQIQHGEKIYSPGFHYADFVNPSGNVNLPGSLSKRTASASKDIETIWISDKGIETLARSLYSVLAPGKRASVIEDKLNEVPEKLQGQAYISEYIIPLLEVDENYKTQADTFINQFITRAYIKSFLDEYEAVCLKDIPVIDSDAILPNEEKYRHLSYAFWVNVLYNLKYKHKRALEYVRQCSGDELIEFKYSEKWKAAVNGEDDRHIILPGGTGKNMTEKKYEKIKIGIITALPKEYAAVKRMFEKSEDVFFKGTSAGNRFCVGEMKSANGGMHQIALVLCGMGNNKASIRVTNMTTHFPEIDSVIMVGIAGGIPSPEEPKRHVRLGDIVISEGIVQYDMVKSTDNGEEIRSNPQKPSAWLLEGIETLKAKEYEDIYQWKKYIDIFAKEKFAKPKMEDVLHTEDGAVIPHPEDDRKGYPKLHYGIIASANTLLKNFKKRQELKEKLGALAVEMEASGIADATWENGIGYLVVRGICDYGDRFKCDDWQEYAAIVAACYTKDLIENLPSFE